MCSSVPVDLTDTEEHIDFLENQYDVAHTQCFDDIIEGLTALCQRHGGALV